MLAATAGAASAQVSKTKGGYRFRVRRTVGDTLRYAVSVKGTNNSQPYLMTGPTVLRVKGKKGDASFIELKFGPLSIGGQPVSVQNTYTFLETSQAVINGGSAVQQMWPVYPKEPIEPGKTWNATTSAEALESTSTERAVYRFVRMTSVEGREMAELAVSLSSSGKADTTGTGRILILAKDGTLWSSVITLTLTPPGQHKKTQLVSSLVRKP